MADKRPAGERDRILTAQIHGAAKHHARWRELSEAEQGASEGALDEPLARQAAGLCRAAGADPEAIPAWIEEGRRRASHAGRPPFSGGMHGRRPRPDA